MDDSTRILARAVTKIGFDALPRDVVHQTKRRLMDSIACAAGAFDYPLCAKMRTVAARQSAISPARVWFTGAKSTPELAGLANGTMVRYLDLSDTILSRAAGHPSDMIPALVALAEAEGAGGKALISAIVAAYGVYGGLCDAVAFQKSSVDQSTAAAWGAAAGASRILGLEAEATGQAMSLALAANVNLYNVRQGALSDWKALAGPNAARNGVFAAQLAAEGLTGPSAVIEGAAGFQELVGEFSIASDERLMSRLLNTHLKAYPVCYHGQSAVDAAIRLAGRVAPEDTKSVLVETYEAAVRVMGNDTSRWTPENRETADHSIPFVVGKVLTSGGLQPDDYALECLRDPALRTFMQKIEVRHRQEFTDAYPQEARSRITVEATHGQIETAETVQPKGNVENPLGDDELEAKLADLWPDSFEASAKDRVADAIWRLETHDDVSAVIDHLCCLA